MAQPSKNFYPHLVIKVNEHPNKLYGFPFLGAFIKVIMIIPQIVEAFFLSIAMVFFIIANPFVVFFSGKYWDAAYDFFLGALRFYTKLSLFMFGLTDIYPGFDLKTNKSFELDIPKPTKPHKWLAFPIFGFIFRLIILIPYQIYSQVLGNGTSVAWMISWFTILFKGKIPESLYEFERDTIRVGLAHSVYAIGLSDTYPSFEISMNHKTEKILLIIAGAILFVFNNMSDFQNDKTMMKKEFRYEKYQDTMNNDTFDSYKNTY